MFAPPDEATRARLKAEHAHRYPQNALLVVYDGPARVTLPFVIGNPTGACDLPAGAPPPSPAWAHMLRAVLGSKRAGDLDALVVADCVLFPDIKTTGRALQRWPDLKADLRRAVVRAVAMDCVSEPAVDAAAPEPIAETLATRPTASWVWAAPRSGRRFALALQPPESSAWRIRREAIQSEDGDTWRALHALVDPAIVLVVEEMRDSGDDLDAAMRYVPTDAAALLARFPGIALGIADALTRRMGATGAAELSDL